MWWVFSLVFVSFCARSVGPSGQEIRQPQALPSNCLCGFLSLDTGELQELEGLQAGLQWLESCLLGIM